MLGDGLARDVACRPLLCMGARAFDAAVPVQTSRATSGRKATTTCHSPSLLGPCFDVQETAAHAAHMGVNAAQCARPFPSQEIEPK